MRAFSLVELSIVLVILGLLTGGVLAGQSLIRAAEIRDVSTQMSKFTTSTYSFRDRYMALPGDMRNATRFWGAANTAGAGGECASPGTNVGSDPKQTCNGDGNGFVQGPDFNERLRYWQHLANAGLLEGSYTGVFTTGLEGVTPGVNVPALKIGGGTACMQIAAADSTLGVEGSFPNYDGYQILTLGTSPSLLIQCIGPFLSAQEAWSIDTKLDDGKPGRGKVQVGKASVWPGCSNSDNENTAEYDVQSTGKPCAIGQKLWPYK